MSRLVSLAIALAAVFGSAALPAQTSAAPPSPNLAGIAHVALRVHDLGASIAFYEKLGFVKAFELSRDGKVYEAFIKINDRQFIELYPTDEKNPQAGFLHLCFEGNDLQSVHDYYVSKGLTPNAVRTAGAGNLLFTMPGPMTPGGLNGKPGPQNLEYTQYMPGSLHSKDFGQHLGPNRIATSIAMVALSVDDLPAARTFYTQKLGFSTIPAVAPASGSRQAFELPGTPAQSVYPLPVSEVGARCYLFLGTDTLPDFPALLRRFKPTEISGDGFLIDPDGDWIFLKASPAALKHS